MNREGVVGSFVQLQDPILGMDSCRNVCCPTLCSHRYVLLTHVGLVGFGYYCEEWGSYPKEATES